MPLYTVQYKHSASLDCAVHTRTTGKYATDYVHVNGHDRTIAVILTKHCIELPDDRSLVIRNMLEQFEIFQICYNISNCIYELCICESVG